MNSKLTYQFKFKLETTCYAKLSVGGEASNYNETVTVWRITKARFYHSGLPWIISFIKQNSMNTTRM